MTRPAPVGTARADTTALTIGSLLSGLAAYGFVAVGTRSVGAEAFAPVSILWSLWAISAAAVTFPVQHWIIRTVEAAGHERPVWATAPAIWKAAAGIGALVFVATWPVGDRLFTVPGAAFPLMAACLPAGSVVMGFNRGVLSARWRFRATAFALLGENLLRVGLAVALAAVITPTGLGWVLVVGFGIGLVFPDTLLHRAPDDSPASPASLLGGLSGANAASQVVLTGGPIVLSLLGGDSAAVTTLFAMLAVLRAPHVLALGVTARLTGPLTRLATTGDDRGLRRVERRVLLATLAISLLGAILGPVVVPFVTDLVFGVGSQVPAVATALLTVGAVVAVAGVVQMLLLLAEGRGRRLATAWAVALAVGGLVLVAGWDPLTRVACAFAVAEVVALGVMMAPGRATVTVSRPDLEEQVP